MSYLPADDLPSRRRQAHFGHRGRASFTAEFELSDFANRTRDTSISRPAQVAVLIALPTSPAPQGMEARDAQTVPAVSCIGVTDAQCK